MSSGITLSSRPWTISVSWPILRSSSSGMTISSTLFCRGGGNIEENASWKPGWMLAS